jgi:H+-translocating NAD(P) transhydrogenase subunit alpha
VIALIMATINVVGGFMVTDRMLQMFKKKEEREA